MRISKVTITMPSSPIDRFPLSDSSTHNSFDCTANIRNDYDEESESEMKKFAKYRFTQGHALLHRQLQRPIILHAQKTSSRRRFTFSGHQEHKVVCKKRRRFTSVVPPTKFLLGGSITDPLNLSSLQDEKINQQLNAFSPASSPMPMPNRRNQVQLIIPPNINDPLNLNTGDDIGFNLLSSKPRKRRRHRKCRREDENTEDPNQISPTDEVSSFDLTRDTQIILFSLDDSLEKELKDISAQPESSSDEKVFEKVVSPVVPQGSPVKVKKVFSRSISRDVEDKSSSQKQVLKQKSLKARSRKNIDSVKYRSNAEKFCYGNHVTNHSNWESNDSSEDPRLGFLDENLFSGKDVLDIGCNAGELALHVAKKWHPKKVVGIDIDKKLINQAQRQVRLHLSKNIEAEAEEEFPESMGAMFGPLSKLLRSSTKTSTEFPNNVSFFEANYVPACEDYLETQKPEYDTILCLRVTKWIHLNFGDEGLKMAFKRMFAQLRNGGHLILEPQPWFTYSASKRITPAMYNTYCSLHMRPDSFCEYLLSDEIGFSSCQTIGLLFHSTKAYRQEVFLLTKGYQNYEPHNLLLNTLSPIPFHHDLWTQTPSVDFSFPVEENTASDMQS